MSFLALPGGDIVTQGIEDLAAGRESPEAFAVALAAPRLRFAGAEIPDSHFVDPRWSLYRWLEAEDERSAHSRFNALVQRVTSFANALEREKFSKAR